MSFCIELCGNWHIIPHPTGTGIALEIGRGIPCEGHAACEIEMAKYRRPAE